MGRHLTAHAAVISLLAGGGLLVSAASVAADPTPAKTPAKPGYKGGEEIIVVEGRHRDAVIGHGFRTVIDVDERRGETQSLAGVLSSSVGINVRSLGGLGGFASVSIRGASASQTAVFVDGVPLSQLAFSTQDLGNLDLRSFSKLEAYRGAVPVALGGAALGGAINLRTEMGPDSNGHIARFSAGGGSFGARHLNARVSDRARGGKLRYHVGLGYRGATGDYEYFNDNGTPLVADDDAYVKRLNNAFDQVSGVGRVRYEWPRANLELGSRTMVKEQGVPSLGSVQAAAASLDTFHQLTDLQLRLAPTKGGTRVGGTAFALVERQEYRDLDGEVGLASQHNRYQTLSAGIDGTMSRPMGKTHALTLGAGTRVERHSVDDMMADVMQGPRGVRWSGSALASDEIAVHRSFIVAPAVRLDYHHTDPGDGWDPVTTSDDDVAARSELFASPRLTLRAPLGQFVVKASVGRYFRAPTITELFGDRGFIVGNPGLKPETGVSADVGAVYAPIGARGVLDHRYVQVAAFASRPRSTIVTMPSSGRAAIAQNLGDASIFGLESAAAVRLWRRLNLAANYTYIDSRQSSPLISYDGKRLPLRPRHQAYARWDLVVPVRAHEIGLWSDVAFTSGNFLDAANLSEVPRRLFLGLGAKARIGTHLVIGVDVKNVTDRRVEQIELTPAPRPDLTHVNRAVSDFLGYPLPGRAIYLTADTSF